ncbi:MAG: hypothetical protein C0P72_010090 [Clostridia bacterium]
MDPQELTQEVTQDMTQNLPIMSTQDAVYSDPVQTETVVLSPDLSLTIEYKVTAGELLLAALLTFMTFTFLLHWAYQTIFRRG